MSIAQDMNENTQSVQQGTNLLKRMGFKMSPKLIAMMKDMDLIKSKEVARVNATNATVKDDVNKAVDEIMVSENQLDPGFPREGRGGEMPTRGNILAEARGNAAQDVIRRMDGGLMNLSPQARMNQGLMQFYPPVQRMANGGAITNALLNYLISQEGFEPSQYQDTSQKAIGYGFNLTPEQREKGIVTLADGRTININKDITEEEGRAMMAERANFNFNVGMNNLMEKGVDVNTLPQGVQFALQDLTYQTGGGIFDKAPNLVEALKANDVEKISEELKTTGRTVGGEVVESLIPRANARADMAIGKDIVNTTANIPMSMLSERKPDMSSEEKSMRDALNQVNASFLPSPGSRDPSGMFGAMTTGSPTQAKRLELEQAEAILDKKKRRAEKIKEGKTVPIARPFLGSPTTKEIKEAEGAVKKKREELEDEQRKALEAKYKEDRGYYDTLDPRGFPDLVTPQKEMTKEEQKAIDEEARLSALEKYPKDYFKTPKKKGEDPQKVELVRDENSPSGYSAKTIVDGEIVLTPTDSDGTRYVHRNKDNKIIRNKDNSIKYFDNPPEGVQQVTIDGEPIIDVEKIKEGIADKISKTEGEDPEQQQKSIDGILAKIKKLPADEVIAFIAGMIDSPTVTAGVKAGLTNALNTRLANKKLDATIAQSQMTNFFRQATLLQGRMGEPMTRGQFTEFFETKYPEFKEAGGWDKMKKRYEKEAKKGSKSAKAFYENIKEMDRERAFDYFFKAFQNQYADLLAPGAYGGSSNILKFNELGEFI